MYCSKCGKEIDYDALVCRECAQAEQTALAEAPATEQGTTPPVSEGNPRMRGFGKALAGAIVGFVAIMLSVIVYIVGMGLVLGTEVGMTAVGVLFGELLAIIPAIFAIVYGVQSIKVFKATPAELPKPIATLVAGIHDIFFGGFALLYSSIFGFVLLMLLVMQ